MIFDPKIQLKIKILLTKINATTILPIVFNKIDNQLDRALAKNLDYFLRKLQRKSSLLFNLIGSKICKTLYYYF